MTITLKIDYYKQSGKWYSGGEVTIECKDVFEITRETIDKQQNLLHSTKEFFLVAKNKDEDGTFFDRLYSPTETI